MLRMFPEGIRREPGRAVLVVLATCAIVVSLGDLLLPVVVLFAAGFIGATAATFLRQPPLIGILLAGFTARNMLPEFVGVPHAGVAWFLRNVALALIMLRAGLGLDLKAVASQPLRTCLLAVGPCLVEVAAVALLAFPFLVYGPAYLTSLMAEEEASLALPTDDFTPEVDSFMAHDEKEEAVGQQQRGGGGGGNNGNGQHLLEGGLGWVTSFDWRWSMLLGFCLSDVSPAVAVPLLLDLQAKGFGSKRGVPSVLIAAASLNAVVAIVGFGVCLNLILSEAGGSGSSSGGSDSSGSNDHNAFSQWLLFWSQLHVVGLVLVEVVGGVGVGTAVGWAAALCLESSCAEHLRKASLFPTLVDQIKRRRRRGSRGSSGRGGSSGSGEGGSSCGGAAWVLPPSALPTFTSSNKPDPAAAAAAPTSLSRKYLFQQEERLLDDEDEDGDDDVDDTDDSRGAYDTTVVGQRQHPYSSTSPTNPSTSTITSTATSTTTHLRTTHNLREKRREGPDEECGRQLGGRFAASLLACAAGLVVLGSWAHMHGGATLAAVCVGVAVKATLAEEGDDDVEGREEDGGKEGAVVAVSTASAAQEEEEEAIPSSVDNARVSADTRTTPASGASGASGAEAAFDAQTSTAARLSLEIAESLLGCWWGGGLGDLKDGVGGESERGVSGGHGSSSSSSSSSSGSSSSSSGGGGGGMTVGLLGGSGQLALFVLLGASLQVQHVIEPSVVAAAAALVVAALIPRAVATFLFAGGADWLWCSSLRTRRKASPRQQLRHHHHYEQRHHHDNDEQWTGCERLFAAVCWCPKATIQAALSSVALDALLTTDSRNPNSNPNYDDDRQANDDDSTPDATAATAIISGGQGLFGSAANAASSVVTAATSAAASAGAAAQPALLGGGSKSSSAGGFSHSSSSSSSDSISSWEEDVQRAQAVLTVAVVAIFVTAPLFSASIAHLGPKLLHKEEQSPPNTQSHSSQPPQPNNAPGHGCDGRNTTEQQQQQQQQQQQLELVEPVHATRLIDGDGSPGHAHLPPSSNGRDVSYSKRRGATYLGSENGEATADLLGLRNVVPALPPPPGTASERSRSPNGQRPHAAKEDWSAAPWS